MINALSSSVQLQYDVQQFRRDESLSYEALVELLRRQVTRIERERNQVTWLRSVQTPVSSIAPSPAVPAATPVLCAFYASGRCNRGNACRYSAGIARVSAIAVRSVSTPTAAAHPCVQSTVWHQCAQSRDPDSCSSKKTVFSLR